MDELIFLLPMNIVSFLLSIQISRFLIIMGAKGLNVNFLMKVVEKLQTKIFKRQVLESSAHMIYKQCYKLQIILTNSVTINNCGFHV